MAGSWRIGEVAQRTGLTRRTLRHYDDLGLLVPSARSTGDYRLYGEADLLRLLQIQGLKALGLSLPEIAAALAEPGLDAAATLRRHHEHVLAQLDQLQQLAERLDRLAEAERRSWEDVLDAIALSRQLAHPDPAIRMRAALQAGSASTDELMAAARAETVLGVQDALVLALTRRPDARGVAIARLGHPDPGVRRLAVWVLAKLRDPAALTALVDRLDDPEPAVVAAVVDALARLGDPAAAGALARLLGDDRVPARDVTDALVGLGPDAAAPVAARAAQASPAVRAHAVEVLERLGVDLPAT